MTGSVVGAGILELTFTFQSRSLDDICIFRILCSGLLTFTFVNAAVPLFLLCGLKGKGNKNISSHLTGWRGRNEIWMSRVKSGVNIQL